MKCGRLKSPKGQQQAGHALDGFHPLFAFLQPAGDSGAGILSTFSARVEMARALGILTEEAAEDFRTLQIIRNHFAHARLVFSFDSDEVVSLLRLLNKNPENDTGLARIQATLGNRNVLVYVVTNYYFALDIYVPGRPVKHGP